MYGDGESYVIAYVGLVFVVLSVCDVIIAAGSTFSVDFCLLIRVIG